MSFSLQSFTPPQPLTPHGCFLTLLNIYIPRPLSKLLQNLIYLKHDGLNPGYM